MSILKQEEINCKVVPDWLISLSQRDQLYRVRTSNTYSFIAFYSSEPHSNYIDWLYGEAVSPVYYIYDIIQTPKFNCLS